MKMNGKSCYSVFGWGVIYGGMENGGGKNMGDFEYLGCFVGKRVILMGLFWGVFLSSRIRENISRFRGCSICV